MLVCINKLTRCAAFFKSSKHQIQLYLLKDWFKAITLKNVNQTKWEWPAGRFLTDLSREAILEALPVFIERLKECGHNEYSLNEYQKILNHAHSDTLDKIKIAYDDIDNGGEE